MDKKTIEIPFGAFDSEEHKWEYTIPEGFEAEITDGKVIVKKKDNEDEKIRKSIIHLLQVGGYMSPADKTKAFAWLEKQKEQNPAEWSEDTIRKAIEEVGLTQHQINWFKNNVFPPKQVWSEEDKVMLNNIIWSVHMKSIIKPLYEMDDRSRYKKYEDFLKALPERFNLQPRTEWSEEDRKMLDAIIKRYSFPIETDFSVFVGEDNLKDMREELGWLKSLRPKPHWKPSEEQMMALQTAVADSLGKDYHNQLSLLEFDLRKRM